MEGKDYNQLSDQNNVLFEDQDIPFIDEDDFLVDEIPEGPVINIEIPVINVEDSLIEKTNLLFEDLDIPFIDEDDHLLGELTQSFLETSSDIGEETQTFLENPINVGEDTQSFIEDAYNTQNGAGKNDFAVAGPSNVRKGHQSDSIGDAVSLIEKKRRHNQKFNAEEISYEARINCERLSDLTGAPLNSIIQCLRNFLQNVIQQATSNLSGTDLIRICIHSVCLDKPISTNLMCVADMSEEKIISELLKVSQSKSSLCLDETLRIDVITIKRPNGAGGRVRRVVDIAVDRLNKKSIITVPMDDSQLCCAKAVVYAIAILENDRTKIESYRKKQRPALRKKAEELHSAANVRLGPCGVEEIKLFENYLNIQICVISSENLNKVMYKGKTRSRRINLWLHNNHYDIIKSLTGFYASNYYCESYDKPYQNQTGHTCKNRCFICFSEDCTLGEPKRCQDCDRLCRSDSCFQRHKHVSQFQQFSICDQIYQCRHCCKVIKRSICPKENHVCGLNRCPSCKKFVQMDKHLCFLNKVSPKSPSSKLMFFDFETDQSSGEHKVNFCVSQTEDGTENVFSGYNACEQFCSFLFKPEHKGYTAIAHNMQGFDGQFVLGWLLEQGVKPIVIPNGSKIMSIELKALNIRVIDSYNFLPMALSKLPSTFGMEELAKGYFPHLFNTEENQNYIGELPDASKFSPDTMSVSSREKFYKWYEERKKCEFDFQKEMLLYCRSDVDILRRCCLEFRKQFMAVAEVDPFQYVTIASHCMATYRFKHIPENTIGMIPVQGYLNKTNYSRDSIRWLEYEAAYKNIFIRHGLNGNGEIKIGSVSVDGFCEETQSVYMFQGCFYHGCDTCYDSDVVNPLTKTTMGELRNKTRETIQKLKEKNFNVIEMWEHTFQIMKKMDENVKKILSTLDIIDRLNPRDAFYGGRTNAAKLYHEGRMKYIDFTSLYPYVNKYCTYPTGHPVIITENFSDLSNYYGVVKYKILPPRGLFHPVLPYRSQNKLTFPLCKKCVENLQQEPCKHSEEERALTGTWVSLEIMKAIEKGYRVIKVYEIYHFPEKSDKLFKSYIDMFLKIKQEASGWPDDCNTEEKKRKYIADYFKKENVTLEYDNIEKNPGRRQVAKLALNSFWGRWGMNLNKTQLAYVSTLPEFHKILTDSSKNVKDIYLPSSDIVALHWEAKDNFLEKDVATNIFIAAFTTCHARLKLYDELDRLGESVLYYDTDSIIYVSTETNDPTLGEFLGEFTDEINGDIIRTFVAGGPKNYAFETVGGRFECKIRGFTLNYNNIQKLNFESVRDLVCGMDLDASITIYNPSKITRDSRKRKVINKEEYKTYKMVYTKRVVREDFSTVPFGY